MKFRTDLQCVQWQVSMNYLLSDQFRLNFGNSCVYRDVSSNCKNGSCCGAFLTYSRSRLCCEVLLEENEVSKNEFDFLCYNNHSEDCVLFLSKEAMFLTA